MECPRCQTSNPADARFCMKCGAGMAVVCAKCGTELPIEAAFCFKCGQRQAEAESEAVPVQPWLQQYIPKELYAKLETTRVSGGMQGERRIVTMLFCDVQGSTAAAEQLDPEDWSEIMNGALEHLIKPVYRYEGTLARIMGDAILAFFGAPISHEDDPHRAVLAGLDILHAIRQYGDQIEQRWGLEFGARVGINTGLVVMGEVGSDLRLEYTALGDAVNVAARMEQTAAVGTVRISADTYKLVARHFDCENLGEVRLKGKRDPVRVYRALGPKPKSGWQRDDKGISAPLIGREPQIDVLRGAIRELLLGRGQIVSVMGEAGLGKSRLIAELKQAYEPDDLSSPGYAEPATQGDENSAPAISWLESWCLSYGSSTPYTPFANLFKNCFGLREEQTDAQKYELIKSHLAEIRPGLEAENAPFIAELLGIKVAAQDQEWIKYLEPRQLRERVFRATFQFFEQMAATQPIVLVLEDLHWTDPTSLDLLVQLMSLTERTPFLIIALFRPGPEDPSWGFHEISARDYPHRYVPVVLGPLDHADSRALVSNLFSTEGLPEKVHSFIIGKTEGNPLFVEEIIRSLLDAGTLVRENSHWRMTQDIESIAVPDTLTGVIISRLDRLDEQSQTVARTAAVIGREFGFDLLADVHRGGGSLEEAIMDLQQRELIRQKGTGPERIYTFQHALTQEATYASLLFSARRELHCRVAECLEKLEPDRVNDIGRHFFEASEEERALPYCVEAGDRAARSYAGAEAILSYTRALEIAGRHSASNQDLAYLYTALGRTLELGGQHGDAIAKYQELEQLGLQRGDRTLEIAGLIPQATILSTYTGKFDPEEGRTLSNRSLALARELKDYRCEAKALWNLMLLETFGGHDHERALGYGEQALAIARQHGLSEERAFILNDIARVYFVSGRKEDAWSVQKESLELWRKQGNLPMLGDSLITSAGAHYLLGQFDEALASVEEALLTNESIGSQWGKTICLYVLSPLYLERGEVWKCIEALKDAIPLTEQVKFTPPVTARARLAIFYGMVGDVQNGFEQARLALSEGGQRQFALAALAQLHLRSWDAVEADAAINEALKEFESGESDPRGGYAIFQVIEGEVALANKQYDRVLALTDRTIVVMGEMDMRVHLADMLRYKGEALLGLGRIAEARKVLFDARAEAEAQGSRRALWPILLAWSRLEAEHGSHDDAQVLRAESQELVRYIADRAGEVRSLFLNRSEIRDIAH